MKLVFQEVETLANSHGMFEYYIFITYVSRISKLVLFVPINEQISTSISKIKDLFNNVVLVTLFKCYGNMCGWKSVIEIHVMLFKQWKLLFKQRYQTDPKFSSFDIFLYVAAKIFPSITKISSVSLSDVNCCLWELDSKKEFHQINGS